MDIFVLKKPEQWLRWRPRMERLLTLSDHPEVINLPDTAYCGIPITSERRMFRARSAMAVKLMQTYVSRPLKATQVHAAFAELEKEFGQMTLDTFGANLERLSSMRLEDYPNVEAFADAFNEQWGILKVFRPKEPLPNYLAVSLFCRALPDYQDDGPLHDVMRRAVLLLDGPSTPRKKDCKHCLEFHTGKCYIEDPEKAPAEQRGKWRERKLEVEAIQYKKAMERSGGSLKRRRVE